MIWTPVVEEDFGQERFLTEHPIKLVTEGKFKKVPLLTGVTEYEFGYKAFGKDHSEIRLSFIIF